VSPGAAESRVAESPPDERGSDRATIGLGVHGGGPGGVVSRRATVSAPPAGRGASAQARTRIGANRS
jgi:hypothetical protein